MSDKEDKLCGKPALSLAYWPGHDPLPVCPDHHAWMIQVGGAMGLHVSTSNAERGATCTQTLEKRAQ